MFKFQYRNEQSSAQGGITIVRIGVALIIFMHPLHGFFHASNIPLFGQYLTSLGYPLGLALAWTVLLLQTLSSLLLIANRWVIPACLGHCVVICFGLIHFHSKNGWYVTGPGVGGMEWGFILLSSLLGVMWAYWPRSVNPGGNRVVNNS